LPSYIACVCEDDQKPATTACVDRSFEANGDLREKFGLLRGESCGDIVGSSQSHGGITPAEMCQMALSDFASNLAAGFTLGGAGLSYTPPSGYTYIADLCASTCGSHGIISDSCGGSGLTSVSASVVTTTTIAELRTRIANAPTTGCDYYWGPNGPITYTEEDWTVRCGNPAMIFLGPGTFLLSGSQLDLRSLTNYEIVGHPDGSTLDAQGLSRIFDMAYKSALTLKNVTLINGRAVDGGAIRLLSRFPAGVELTMSTMMQVEASRLTIRGGAIRDCEATNDGGAVAAISESAMFGVDCNMLDVEISGCRAGNRGGAVHVKDMNMNMADMRLRNNSAAAGGALSFLSVPNAQIYRSSFIGHAASGNGGVLTAVGSGRTL